MFVDKWSLPFNLNSSSLQYVVNMNILFVNRGFVQCLKLSPNLRKQTKEVRTALLTKDEKKAHFYQVKKLETLLAMVREPDVNSLGDTPVNAGKQPQPE